MTVLLEKVSYLPCAFFFFQRKALFMYNFAHISLNFCSQELYNVWMVNDHTIFFISFVLELLNHFKVHILSLSKVANIVIYQLFLLSISHIPFKTEKLNLRKAEFYKYLNQSSCCSIAGVDDSEMFFTVMVKPCSCP
jgi:hypothetical protein